MAKKAEMQTLIEKATHTISARPYVGRTDKSGKALLDFESPWVEIADGVDVTEELRAEIDADVREACATLNVDVGAVPDAATRLAKGYNALVFLSIDPARGGSGPGYGSWKRTLEKAFNAGAMDTFNAMRNDPENAEYSEKYTAEMRAKLGL